MSARETGPDNARGRRCRIVILAKAPIAGFAKTRLIPALGPEGAAALATALLLRTVRTALGAGIGPVELCVTPGRQEPIWATLPLGGPLAWSDQGEGDLGERMGAAAQRGLAHHEPVILIGTDCPDLGVTQLRQAALQLGDHDAAIVPAADGGYALLGLNRQHPDLFRAMPWSTDAVLSTTLQRLAALGWSVASQPVVTDIDEPGDLLHLPPELADQLPARFDTVLVIIPVLNEQDTLAGVIGQLQSIGLHHIRVVDNGSTDASAAVATAAGAELLREPVAGYGRACWRGLMQLPEAIEWILFCDGDGSDDLGSLPGWSALLRDHDLILGNREATAEGRRALTPVQRFGNRLATSLIRLGWGHRYQDLGPLRLVRRRSLEAMGLRDRGFGWTIEMQVRAVEAGLRICELPVPHHPRRGGRSKISGTVGGSLRAGLAILGTLSRLYRQRRLRTAAGRWARR